MSGADTTVGVVVMRVQVPALHEGHRQLLDYVQSQHNLVFVVLGSPRGFPTNKNPLSYEVRKTMMLQAYPAFTVGEIKDHPVSPTYWSEELDLLIASQFPDRVPILYGSRDSFLGLYSGRHKTQYVASENEASGTKIRNELTLPSSEDARAALIYREMHRAPMVYPTITLGIKREDRALCMVKHLHHGAASFIEGYVDPGESAEQAVFRELHQQAPGIQIIRPQFRFSLPVNDPRYRNSRDSMLTSFFETEHLFGEAKTDDTIGRMAWVHRSSIVEHVVPWQRPLAIEFARNW